MATLRDLKRRIRSVRSTQQITKAMEMVAAAKLRKAQEKLGAARPYSEKMAEVLRLLSSTGAAAEHPFFVDRGGPREAVVLVTSNRGLCGSFNMQVCRSLDQYAEEKGLQNLTLVAVGKKGIQYFRHRRWNIPHALAGLGDQVDLAMVQTVTRATLDLFQRREVDRVSIVSMRFVSATRRHVERTPFLPVVSPAGAGRRDAPRDYLFEPSQEEIFAELLPRYTTALFYSILAESFTAEHSARMVAMGSATRNAAELIDALILQRNRLRQAAITAELADIVGAVEALT